MSLIIYSIVGLIIGYFTIHSPIGGLWWASLLIWGIVGLIIGWLSRDKKHSLKNGALYGLFLCDAFIVAGYKAPFDHAHIKGFIALLIIFGVIGIICGLFSSFVGQLLKIKLKK